MISRNLTYKNLLKDHYAFTIVELLVVVSMMGILASLSVPSLIRWVYNERQNSYIRELQEFIPLIIREARRWGGTCTIKPNLTIGVGQEKSGLDVQCVGISVNNTQNFKYNIRKGPNISKNIFQEISGDLTVTPKGQIFIKNSIANSTSLVFVVGGRNNSGINNPKCIVFEAPVGIYKVGRYNSSYNFNSNRIGSSYNRSLNQNNCQ